MTTVTEAFDLFDKWVRDGCEYHPLLISELQGAFTEARAEVERLRAERDALREAGHKFSSAHSYLDLGIDEPNVFCDPADWAAFNATLAAVPAPQADDRLAVAERAAKSMRWECVKVAENYLTGKEARHIAGAMDLLDAPGIARRAVAEQEKKP